MTTSKSKSEQVNNTTDQRTTQTINAGIGGDIEDSTVVSGNYGDTSLQSFVDSSSQSLEVITDDDYSYSYDSDNDYTDNSDNSFKLELDDNSNRSVDNSVSNITDGGAFAIVDNIGGKLIDTLGENQRELFGGVTDLLNRGLDASNNLAARSLDGALSIKAGQTITEPANQTVREVAKAGVIVAGIAGAAYAANKVFGGKK